MDHTDDRHAFDPILATILQKTYDQHALGTRPWGVRPDVTIAGGCSYAAGCAIGISLAPATAQRLDRHDPEVLTIAELLDKDVQLRAELLGTEGPLPDRPGQFLKQLQHHHDFYATMRHVSDYRKRRLYRRRLEQVADDWGLPLQKGESPEQED